MTIGSAIRLMTIQREPWRVRPAVRRCWRCATTSSAWAGRFCCTRSN